MKIYISFMGRQVGPDAHHIDGKVFDKDCLAGIECDSHEHGREIAFENFGPKFFTSYEDPDMKYFPRGVVPLNYEEEAA